MHLALLVAATLVTQIGPLGGTFTLGQAQLPIVDQSLMIEMEGQHATTNVETIFHNQTGRRVEGVYELRTAPGTEVVGFSYWNGEQRIVGEVFEKETARSVYEGVRDRRRDPGFLERVDEGLFRFRVFPIEPDERKLVQVRYARWLTLVEGRVEYRATLGRPDAHVSAQVRGLAHLPQLSSPTHELRNKPGDTLRVQVLTDHKRSGKEVVLRWEAVSSQWRPLAHAHRNAGERGYVNIALAAPKLPAARASDRDVTLVLDRSGSMAGPAFRRAKEAALEIIERLGPRDRANVVFFDDVADRMVPLPVSVSEYRQTLRDYVERTHTGGGTDIARGLTSALEAQAQNDRPKFVLLITDGQSESRLILRAARKTPRGVRVFTVGLGEDVEKPVLSRLASDTGGRFVYIDDSTELQPQVVRLFARLNQPLWVGTAIEINGQPLQRAYPRTLPDIFPGDELRVSGRYDGIGDLNITLKGRVNGEPRVLRKVIRAGDQRDRPWVGRLWARSRVDELMELEAEKGPNIERTEEIIDLAVAYNFVTQHTAFLAIPANEATGANAMRLGAAREHKRKLLQRHRDAAALSNPTELAQGRTERRMFSLGSSGSGTTGGFDLGGGGGSTGGRVHNFEGGLRSGGSGARLKSNRAAPRVRLSAPMVMGSLSKDAIQKVINRNKNQIRYCYEKELQRHHDLAGRIVIRFVISAGGETTSVRVESTTIENANMQRCIVRAIERWKFPQPGGGGVIEVNYPFVFTSE